MSKYGVISGPYFPVLGLNTEVYSLNLRIQSEYSKLRIGNNSVLGHFSRSDDTQNSTCQQQDRKHLDLLSKNNFIKKDISKGWLDSFIKAYSEYTIECINAMLFWTENQ